MGRQPGHHLRAGKAILLDHQQRHARKPLATRALLVAAVVALGTCNRPRGPAAQSRPATSRSSEVDEPLPDIAGFVAGPITHQASATRRTYVRGQARISVTLARLPMTDRGYQDWVRTSTESFPQAALDVPAGDGNGFYQCNQAQPPSCDLLIQLRSGRHLELRSSGSSSRRDVDDLARGLPLRQLAR